jgi:hypothetical protein
MSTKTYQEPVSRLLTFGDFHDIGHGKLPNYVEQFGFTDEDIPELIRMATDETFNTLNSDRPEVWAPLHAWHTLGQLHAAAAVEPLLGLLALDDDYVYEEMPEVFGNLGGAAIPALTQYLADDTPIIWARITVADCLREIATTHPDQREAAIAPLLQQLERYAENDDNLNSTLINNLAMLKVVEAAPLMEQAFASGEIDEFLTGSWARVQVDLGLKQESDFTAEELKVKVPPQLAEFHQNLENLAKSFGVQQQQFIKPEGFGAAPAGKAKKTQKKKKK